VALRRNSGPFVILVYFQSFSLSWINQLLGGYCPRVSIDVLKLLFSEISLNLLVNQQPLKLESTEKKFDAYLTVVLSQNFHSTGYCLFLCNDTNAKIFHCIKFVKNFFCGLKEKQLEYIGNFLKHF